MAFKARGAVHPLSSVLSIMVYGKGGGVGPRNVFRTVVLLIGGPGAPRRLESAPVT